MWDERYNEPGFAYGTEANEFLTCVSDQIPKGRVLSLCEGEGRNAVFLAKQGFEVHAVDASPVGLEKAKQLANANNVDIRTRVTNLAEFIIEPESWDGIISIFCHIPAAVRRQIHTAVVHGLKPGGVLVLEAYTPAQLTYGTGGPASTELTMGLHKLEEELRGLDFVHACELERKVVEGKYHTGLGHVVQIVARKPTK